MDKRYYRILGCLVSAAIGDAMGCPLETRPVYLIKKDFGHGDFVYDYMTPLDDSIAKEKEGIFDSEEILKDWFEENEE